MSYEDLKNELRNKRLGITNSPEKEEKNNNVVENDNYNIDAKFQRLKRLIDKSEPRLYKFLFKGQKDPSVDARNILNEARKLIIDIRLDILKQRQDNQSQY